MEVVGSVCLYLDACLVHNTNWSHKQGNKETKNDKEKQKTAHRAQQCASVNVNGLKCIGSRCSKDQNKSAI